MVKIPKKETEIEKVDLKSITKKKISTDKAINSNILKLNKEESQKRRKFFTNNFGYKNFFKIFFILFILSSIINSIIYIYTPKIAVVPIYGVITTTGGNSFYSDSVNARELSDKILRLKDDDSVKAILLDINSPGGSPVGSEIIAKTIIETSKKKPVYSVIEDIGASGGYWIAIASNKTYASEMSIVGSIGVTSASFGLENFLKEHNITYRRLVAGKYKDLNSPFRNLTTDEKELLNNILHELHAKFKKYVSERRNISLEELEPYAEGQIFLGTDAKKIDLIDEIGTYNDVLNRLKNITNNNEAMIVIYKNKKTLSDILNEFRTIFRIPYMTNQYTGIQI